MSEDLAKAAKVGSNQLCKTFLPLRKKVILALLLLLLLFAKRLIF